MAATLLPRLHGNADPGGVANHHATIPENEALGQQGKSLKDHVDPEAALLHQRIETLTKTADSKDLTIQAQRQTISYQEVQLRRLRDTVFLLRCNVAELTDCLKHHLISLPGLLQEMPPCDEALENARDYEGMTKEQVTRDLEKQIERAAAPREPEKRKSVRGDVDHKGVIRRSHVYSNAPSSPRKGGSTVSVEDDVQSVATSMHSSLASSAQRQRQGESHGKKRLKEQFAQLSLSHKGGSQSARGGGGASEVLHGHDGHQRDGSNDRHRGRRGHGGASGGYPKESAREDPSETPSVLPREEELVHHSLYASEACQMVERILRCQFQRSQNKEVLSYLLGNQAREKFEKKCLQMLVETVCCYLVSKNVSYHQELQRFVPQWLMMIVELTECEQGSVFVYDEDSGELFSRCLTGAFSHPLRIKKGTGIVGQVFETGRPILIADAYDNLQFNPTIDRRTKFKTKSVLCCPLKMGPKVIGCVELMNKKLMGGVFTGDDLKLVDMLGTLITPGLTSPKLHRQLKQHHAYESRVLKQAISGDKNRFMSPLVREIMKCVSQILETERCTLFLSDPVSRKLWAIISQGLDNIHIEIPDNRGIAGAVYQNNIILNIPDCYSDPRFNQAVDRESGFKTRTILCAPIPHTVTGKPLGVIQAINKIGGVFTQSDERHMEQLCAMVSSILMTSDSVEELTCSAELNERVFQCLSVATVVLNSVGNCVKVNRDGADLFFLESPSQWIGKHASEIFSATNPTLFQMWARAVETEEEQTEELPIYPFVGEAEGELRSVRFVPFRSSEGMIGVVLTLTPFNVVVPVGGGNRSRQGSGVGLETTNQTPAITPSSAAEPGGVGHGTAQAVGALLNTSAGAGGGANGEGGAAAGQQLLDKAQGAKGGLGLAAIEDE